MKRILLLFCTGALIGAFGTACDDKLGENEVRPVSPGRDVSAFFEEHLPAVSSEQSDFFFYDDDSYEPKCLMINSDDEFRESISSDSSVELPAIDFDAYTLIIGQYWLSGGMSLQDYYITIEGREIISNLIFKDSGKGLAVMLRRYYWGLYPKFEQEFINVNVVIKKDY